MSDDPMMDDLLRTKSHLLHVERALDRSIRDCLAGTMVEHFLDDDAGFEAEVERRKDVYLEGTKGPCLT